jgi:predicted phosphodiesterase
MINIGVITDAHANLPALTAVLDALAIERCDTIVHTGDAIGIGPHPAEVLNVMLNAKNLQSLMGNHDEYFSVGLPEAPPPWMSHHEFEHQRWTHRQLSPEMREAVARWPFSTHVGVHGVEIRFCYYPRNTSGTGFAPIIPTPTASEFDELFQPKTESLVFYGHHHPRSDLTGRARYVNAGALGGGSEASARFAVLEVSEDGDWRTRMGEAPYDMTTVLRNLEARDVPA